MTIHATFVLPAPNGCNLACPFCIIAQRQETKPVLGHEDYVRFLSDVLTHFSIGQISIQGYEPLLPEVWPLTWQVLRLSSAFFARTSLVTNGTYLARYSAELANVAGTVAVSLDSAKASTHDKLRGTLGAFERTLEGIRAAVSSFPEGSVTVNSVLLPGKADHLVGMPRLLHEVGVTEWTISPLISVKKEYPGPWFIKKTILRFADEAKALGIHVSLSDELRTMQEAGLFAALPIRSLGVGDQIFRLSPDGSCSRGKEILGLADRALAWDREEAPNKFLARVFRDQSLQRRSRFGSVMAHYWAGLLRERR